MRRTPARRRRRPSSTAGAADADERKQSPHREDVDRRTVKDKHNTGAPPHGLRARRGPDPPGDAAPRPRRRGAAGAAGAPSTGRHRGRPRPVAAATAAGRRRPPRGRAARPAPGAATGARLEVASLDLTRRRRARGAEILVRVASTPSSGHADAVHPLPRRRKGGAAALPRVAARRHGRDGFGRAAGAARTRRWRGG